MNREPLRIDRLIEQAANGSISRRDLIKRATALGLGAPMIGALLGAASMATPGGAAAQEMTLSFDAAATGGGGGKPNAAATDYCYIVNGGSQFELNRMVDARLSRSPPTSRRLWAMPPSRGTSPAPPRPSSSIRRRNGTMARR